MIIHWINSKINWMSSILNAALDTIIQLCHHYSINKYQNIQNKICNELKYIFNDKYDSKILQKEIYENNKLNNFDCI